MAIQYSTYFTMKGNIKYHQFLCQLAFLHLWQVQLSERDRRLFIPVASEVGFNTGLVLRFPLPFQPTRRKKVKRSAAKSSFRLFTSCLYLTNTNSKAEPAPPITAVFSPLTRYRAWETLGVRHS